MMRVGFDEKTIDTDGGMLVERWAESKNIGTLNRLE